MCVLQITSLIIIDDNVFIAVAPWAVRGYPMLPPPLMSGSCSCD